MIIPEKYFFLLILFFIVSCREETRYVHGFLMGPDDLPLANYQVILIENKPTINSSTAYKYTAIDAIFTDKNGYFFMDYETKKKSMAVFELEATIIKNENGIIYPDSLPHGKYSSGRASIPENDFELVNLSLSPLGSLILKNEHIDMQNDSLSIKACHIKALNTDDYVMSDDSEQGKTIEFPIGKIIIDWKVFSGSVMKSGDTGTIYLSHGEKKEFIIKW